MSLVALFFLDESDNWPFSIQLPGLEISSGGG
jgi:hypothetical protein